MLVPISYDKRIKIVIGRSGENETSEVSFDLTDWVNEYGQGHPYMHVKRHGDAFPYPITLAFEDNIATWTISSIDTEKEGYGQAQLVYVVDNKIRKTIIYRIYVDKSVSHCSFVPDPYETWLDELTALAEMVNRGYEEYDAMASAYIDEINTKYAAYIDLANEKELTYNTLANTKEAIYRELAEGKEAAYNTLADTKEAAYNDLADSKELAYNTLANAKEADYRELSDTKEAAYNDLAETKEAAYNTLADTKEADYNTLADTKEADYNTLAETKEEAYITLTEQGEAAITELIEHGISVTDDGEGHVAIHIGGVN